MANKIFTNAKGKKIKQIVFWRLGKWWCVCFRIKQLANKKYTVIWKTANLYTDLLIFGLRDLSRILNCQMVGPSCI